MSTMRAELPTITLRRGPSAVAVVRLMGRVALTTGLFLGGFVAYQVGVTTLLAIRAQADLKATLVDRVPLVSFTTYLPTAGVVSPFAAPDRTVPGGTLLVESAPPVGEALGRIEIPTAGVDWVVVEGTDRASLRTGAGHMPTTALPGQPGNAVISGHRTTYGAPFRYLDRVGIGDRIVVTTGVGTHVYEVVDSRIITPDDLWVTTQWDGSWLTLTTCHPVFSARERLVVVARLVGGPNAAALTGP